MADDRTRHFEELFHKHADITKLLINIEEILTGQEASGKSPQMIYFFEHWERRLFETVHRVSLTSAV